MPLLPHVHTPICERVSDRQIGDLTICQVAEEVSIITRRDPWGNVEVIMDLLVHHYAPAGTELGPDLGPLGLPPRPVQLEANNLTLVAFPSGEIISIQNQVSAEAWQEALARPEDMKLQGDFFEWMLEQALPNSENAMKRHHVQQADRMGRFA
jgi:hypothetical protein